jgi:N utilization substance protein B
MTDAPGDSERRPRRRRENDVRSDARERALTILYEAHSKQLAPRDAAKSHLIAPDELTMRLVVGVEDHRDELDTIIGAHSVNWAIERMPVLDVNIMRIALYELAYLPEVPTAVAIDEAVELAKRFSTDDSGRFVNGILAAAAGKLRH